MSIRPVKRLIKSKPTIGGAGVHLHRAFGFGNKLQEAFSELQKGTFLKEDKR